MTKIKNMIIISVIQFSRLVVSDSLLPHEQQHARPPCASPTPGVHSNSCPSSQWCHPAISSSVVPFSSCPQSLPASGSFPMRQLFTWGGQSIGVSFSFSIIPSNEHSGLISFSMDWLDLLAVQGTLRSFLQHHSSKASILQHSVQFSSVTQSCLTLCDPINCSTPVLPVHHQLLQFTKTHVHRIGDAIQPSHPLLSPFPPAPNPSQHQSLFQWVNSSHEVAKVLEFQL